MWCGTGHNCSPASNYYETSFPYPTVILRGMNELKYMGKILLSESLYFQHKDVFDSLVAKGETRLVKKYGLVGLALFMAIPIPTIGVYGGTLLSWLMGMNWWSSLIAVVSGTTVSNSIVLLSVLGIIHAIV